MAAGEIQDDRSYQAFDPSIAELMKQQVSSVYGVKFWEPRFPNQLPKRLVSADELESDVIDCEAEQLAVVPLKFTDTAVQPVCMCPRWI
jgi:hypothetical protein